MRPPGFQEIESLLEEARTDSPAHHEPFGDQCGSIASSELRVISLNMAGFPHKRTSQKNKIIQEFVNKLQPDLLLLQELDTAFNLLPTNDRLEARLRDWFPDSKSVAAWYGDYPALKSPRQYGGTAVIAFNQAVHKVESVGRDPTGLGRWCWLRLRGKGGSHFRVISAYRPVLNKSDDFSCYNQQQYYFGTQGDHDICPRKQLVKDLQKEIEEWTTAGDDVCFGTDFNEDIRTDPQFQGLLEKTGMYEAIIEKHGSSGPPTRQDGNKVLDGLCFSAAVQTQRSGYLEFTEGLSDHRPLFGILRWEEIFGQPKAAPTALHAKRLKCDDPRVMKKYLNIYHKYLIQHNLYKRASKLEQDIKQGEPLTDRQQREYEWIDATRFKGMMLAERKCRKLRAGYMEW